MMFRMGEMYLWIGWRAERTFAKRGVVVCEELHITIAIISNVCKVCMMMVNEGMNDWVESSEMLGDEQGGFRRGRMTEYNLFMIERLMKWCDVLCFMDAEKAYDWVDSGKLFEIREFGFDSKLVSLVKRREWSKIYVWVDEIKVVKSHVSCATRMSFVAGNENWK